MTAEDPGSSTRRASLDSSPWLGSYDAYGVTVNTLAAGDLFRRYEQAGFLYPAKRAQLEPVLGAVTETWRRSMLAPIEANLHHCIHFEDESTRAWSTVSFWRSSHRRGHSQHMVSSGHPRGSRAVLLAAQDRWACSNGYCCENWFRLENRYPARLFGTVPDRLGPDNAAIELRQVLGVSKGIAADGASGIRVQPVDASVGAIAMQALVRIAGRVIATAEELDDPDIELHAVDELYRSVGLRRKRSVFLASVQGSADPIGVAVAYRGPIGLNFSFLENKLDIWVDPTLDAVRQIDAATSLISAASSAYRDFELPYILVACDPSISTMLSERVPCEPIRTYARCVWLRGGFEAWYAHVDQFYKRLLERAELRRSVAVDRSIFQPPVKHP